MLSKNKTNQFSAKLAELSELSILALFAGGILPLSLSPFDYNLISFISVILLIYCTEKISEKISENNIKKYILYGYLYGLGSFGFGVSWIYISIHEHGNASPLLAGFLTLLLIMGLLAFFPVLKLILYKYLIKNNKNNNTLNLLIIFPSVWVIIDWLQSWIFTGFPWLYIGYSQTDSVLSGFAPIISVFGLSWLVVFISSLVYLIIKNIFIFIKNNNNQYCLNKVLVYILILAFIFISGTSLKNKPWTVKDPLIKERVILVQGNIPQEHKWEKDKIANNINKYINLTKPYWDHKWGHSTIIWPESAVPMPLHYLDNLVDSFSKETKKYNSTLMFGVPVLASLNNNNNQTPKQYYNSIFSVNNNRVINTYYKNKLVPWGEYVPLENIFRGLINFFDLPMSHFIPGNDNTNYSYNILNSEHIKWLPFICYEIAYPNYVISHANLGNAIITISNDAWFGDSIGPWQHLQLAKMRALETGRFVVRSTNNGVTAVIGPDGKIIKQIPQFQAGVLITEISPYDGSTPIMYYGVNFIILLCFMALIICYISQGRRGAAARSATSV